MDRFPVGLTVVTGPSPSLRLLGVRIDLLTMQGLHEKISQHISTSGCSIVAYINIHAVNLACDIPWFKNFLNNAEITFCDGHGVMLGARILGCDMPEKITAAHWTPLFAKYCADHGHSWFLLGSEPGIAEEAAHRLQSIAPGLKIVGSHHGFFDKSSASPDNARVIELINQADPDILFVGFGMPLQEKWVMENRGHIHARVALMAGATLNYAAGHHKRPPGWLTDHGLEWLGRWWYEPKRLAGRYFIGNPLFLARCVRERVRLLGKQES